MVYLKLASCLACLSSELERYFIVLTIVVQNSVWVIYGEVKVEVVVASVEVVGTYISFVEGDTVMNKYQVGILK